MRRILSAIAVALGVPLAAHAQSFDSQDWTVTCDNTRTCRAAGYSVEGSAMPVSLLIARAAGPNAPVYGELQLGVLAAGSVHPSSVSLAGNGKAAIAIRVDRNNHAELAASALIAILKSLSAGGDVIFSSGKSTWRLSGAGAVEALQKMDDAQGRSGGGSALIRKGPAGAGDVASAMAIPRMDAARIPTAPQPDDAALAVRVLSAIQSTPDCPLLDDGASQSQGRLWHLDANRLLVTQPCKGAAGATAQGWWLANRRPPYDARPLTYAGEFDGVASITARVPAGSSGDCATAQGWTWTGYRFEQTYAATGGLCRGVKAGGAWEIPSLVADVVPAK
ncbi:MAG TPA: DUF1176 domain-containing protein [Burkholderiaceae bacterium]